MKKKFLFIIVLLLFVIPIPVFASICDTIDTDIATYEKYKNEFDTKCSGEKRVESEEQECVNLALKIDKFGTDFINAYYNEDISDSCKSKIEFITNDNNCGQLLDDFYDIVHRILRYIYILAPILLIIFVGIDLFSLLVSGGGPGDKSSSKIKGNIFKRLIAFILLYITPTIINFIISLNSSEYNLSGNYYTCNNTSNYLDKEISRSYGDSGNPSSPGPKEDPTNPDCINPDGTRTAGCKKMTVNKM